MWLEYSSPEAREAFIEWYIRGEHKDISGNDIEPENHPDIIPIVAYFNNEIAYGPAVEVIDGED